MANNDKKTRNKLAKVSGSKTGKLKKKHLTRAKILLRLSDTESNVMSDHSLTKEELQKLGV